MTRRPKEGAAMDKPSHFWAGLSGQGRPARFGPRILSMCPPRRWTHWRVPPLSASL